MLNLPPKMCDKQRKIKTARVYAGLEVTKILWVETKELLLVRMANEYESANRMRLI